MSQYPGPRTKVAVLVVLLGAVVVLGGRVALAQEDGPAIDWWVISGGGGPSGATGVTPNDTPGAPPVTLSADRPAASPPAALR